MATTAGIGATATTKAMTGTMAAAATGTTATTIGTTAATTRTAATATTAAIARTAATIAATTTEPRPLTTSPSWRRTARLAASSIRVRVVVVFFVLLATALTVSIVVVRQVQSARIQRDAELDVVHEAEELRRIAALGSRESGAPYGRDVTALFDEFLATHAAGDDEAFYTIPLDGRQAAEGIRRSFGAPTALIENSALLDHWTGSTTVSMGNFQTTAGNIVALAVPVLGPAGDDGDSLAVADGSAGGTNGDVLGVFVVTRFTDNQFDDLDDLVGLLALAGLAVLAITTMLAWSLAGRVVAPVRQLTRTARAITHSDLSARLPVNGHGEIAELGRTFNEMVDRLDSGVHAQRQFLNDVAHDLRTPITIARGHLEVLGDDPAERDAAVTIVIDELDRMGRAVSDLLVLAKAEQPHFLRLQPVDFGDLAVDVLARVSALAPRRWVVDDAPRPGMLAGVADADRLIQAMLNLAVNAAQHSDADDEIGIGVAADAPGWVRLWVRDRGPGVDPERRRRLVWALCPRWACRRRGTPRWRRPRVGHRRRHLPSPRWQCRAGSDPRGRSNVHHPHPVGAVARRGDEVTRILIAEDEHRIVAFLEKGLQASGYTTMAVNSGTEALAMARDTAFDLVLLDLGLRGLDGQSVLRSMRTRGETVPVIILTARDGVEDTVAALEGGADDYVTKPFRFEELVARIRLRLRDTAQAEPSVLTAGRVVLDLLTRRASVDEPDGTRRSIELTAREFALAETFLRHAGQVLSREQLLSHVWGYHFDPGSNVVEVYIRYLRRKLGADTIETVRGMGYRLRT